MCIARFYGSRGMMSLLAWSHVPSKRGMMSLSVWFPVLSRGGLSRGVWHPPVNKVTDTCKNITFPQLRLWAVIK